MAEVIVFFVSVNIQKTYLSNMLYRSSVDFSIKKLPQQRQSYESVFYFIYPISSDPTTMPR